MVEVPSSNLGSPTKYEKGPLISGPFSYLQALQQSFE
jgi:hypothetical protein